MKGKYVNVNVNKTTRSVSHSYQILQKFSYDYCYGNIMQPLKRARSLCRYKISKTAAKWEKREPNSG